MRFRIKQTWGSILKREWLLNRQALAVLTFIWILLFFAFPVVGNSMEELILCCFIAIFVGYRLGTSDFRDGAEEFALVLPPRRTDYLFCRFLAGLIVVCAFVLGAWAMGWLIPRMWGIAVQSGMTEPGLEGAYGYKIWWGLSSRLATVVGVFTCVFVSARMFSSRMAWMGIPMGVLLCYSSGLIGIAVGQKLTEAATASEWVFQFLTSSWALACLLGALVLLAIGWIDAKSKQYKDARVIRFLVLALLAIIWTGSSILVAGLEPSVSGFLPTGSVWSMLRWSVVLLILLWSMALSIWATFRRGEGRSAKPFSRRIALLFRCTGGGLAVTCLAWLWVQHREAIRDGYSFTPIADQTVSWPAAEENEAVNVAIFATPVFDPDSVIAAFSFSISPDARRDFRYVKDSFQPIEIEGVNGEVVTSARWAHGELMKLSVQGGSEEGFVGTPFWMKSETGFKEGIDSVIPFTGENGRGFFGPRIDSLGVWGTREQGLSMPHRLWCAAFSAPSEPSSVAIEELIARAKAANIVEADPSRLFEKGVLGSGFSSLRVSGIWDLVADIGSFSEAHTDFNATHLSAPNRFMGSFGRAAIIGIACVIVIALCLPRWRKRSFLVLVLLLTGWFALLDRISVNQSIAVIESEDATVQSKAVAATKLSRTFFWKQSAKDTLWRAIASDPGGIGRFFEEIHSETRIVRRNK